MLQMVSNNSGNQVNWSLLCVASPRLLKTGEEALKLVVSKLRFRRFWKTIRLKMYLHSIVLA